MENKIKNCRLCGSKLLKKIIDLQKMPLGDKYAQKKNQYNELTEINILQCKTCLHMQTSTVPSREKLYKNYLSRPVAVNSALSDSYKIYAEDLKKYLKKDDLICEIGSNDGSFLNFFKSKGYKKIIGIEPAENLASKANRSKIRTYNNFFGDEACFKVLKDFKQRAKLIINNHSLSNISNIREVFKNAKSLLERDGVYTIQTFYTVDVFSKFLLENFNHEHLHYFFVTTINYLAKKNGLEVFKAFKINAKGGSIRTYLGHIGDHQIDKSVTKIIKEEKKVLTNSKFPKKVEKFISLNGKKIRDILDKNKYKKIIGYGTSIGATTFLTQYKIDKRINFLIDDDPYRQNRYSPGSNIKTTSNNIIKKEKPDAIIVLAPLYFKNIKEKIIKNFGKQNIIKIWPQALLIKK